MADNPDAQKFVNKYAGGDLGGQFIDLAQKSKQASQFFQQQMSPQQGPQVGPPAPNEEPTTPEGIRTHANILQAGLMDPTHAAYLQPHEYENVSNFVKSEHERADRLEAELQRAKYESPEAKAAARKAEVQAGIDVSTAPENVSKEAGAKSKISAAEGAAGASARLGVELSPSTTEKKAAQERVLAPIRRAPADATLEKKRQIDTVAALQKQYEKVEPPPIAPQVRSQKTIDAYNARRDAWIREHGVDPISGSSTNPAADAVAAKYMPH